MTVTAATTRNDYTATSGQTVFPYTFTALADSDIKVLKNGVAISLGVDFTISGVPTYGGNVTLATGAALNDKISVYLDMPLSRTTNYQNSGDFLALDVNGDFNKLWIALQQTETDFDRAIRRPLNEPGTINMQLPAVANRSNKLLTFDGSGAVLMKDYVDGALQTLNVDAFTGDGTTTAFSISGPSTSVSMIQVNIDGIIQQITTYTVSGSLVTLSEAPPKNASIEIRVLYKGEVVTVDSTDLNVYDFTGNGVTLEFTLPEAAIENNLFIYIDGVYQSKSGYNVSGTTVTFSSAPPNNSAIEMVLAAFVKTSVGTIPDNSVSTASLQNLAVTTGKIANGAITSAKLGAGVGGAFNDFAIKTTAYTAVTRDQLIVNSSSAVTITLPASPSAGNVVFIKNAGAGTVTVARNGSKINSQTQDGTLAADAAATLVFVNATIGYKEL
jgi:hypothetical protein